MHKRSLKIVEDMINKLSAYKGHFIDMHGDDRNKLIDFLVDNKAMGYTDIQFLIHTLKKFREV